MRRSIRGQEGLTVVAVLVYILIAAAVYLAILYFPLGLRYYEIREAVGHAANLGHTEFDDNYLHYKCSEFIRRGAGITIRPEECQVRRDRSGARIITSYTYTETVHFVPSDHKEFYKFDITVESDAR